MAYKGFRTGLFFSCCFDVRFSAPLLVTVTTGLCLALLGGPVLAAWPDSDPDLEKDNRDLSPVVLPAHIDAMQPMSVSPVSADTLLPVGTTFQGSLTSPLYSRDSYPGDLFQLVLNQALVSPDGHGSVPAGSLINARVKEVKDSKLAHIKARMAIEFYEIVLPDGQRITMDASVDSKTGYLKGNKRQGQLFTFAWHQAVKTGVGLAAGAAAGFGTGIVLMTVGQRGQDVLLEKGDAIPIRLNRPIYFSRQPAEVEGFIPVNDTSR